MTLVGQPLGDGSTSKEKLRSLLALGAEHDGLDFKEYLDLSRHKDKVAESRTTGRPLDLAALEADLFADDDSETTLVIGRWQYVGSGWGTEGETILAAAAAARAREYAQWKAEQRRKQETSGERTRG